MVGAILGCCLIPFWETPQREDRGGPLYTRLGSQDKFYIRVLTTHSTAGGTAFQMFETIPPESGCWLER